MLSLTAWVLLSSLATVPADVDILVFVAQNCPHCQQLRPELAELKTAGIRVQEIDALAHRASAVEWKVESVPTIIILQNQKEVDRIVGRLSKTDLLKRLPADTTATATLQQPTRSIGSISDMPNLDTDRLRNLNRDTQVVPASATVTANNAPNMDTRGATAEANLGNNNLPRNFPQLQRDPLALPMDPELAKQNALTASVRLRIESESMQSNGSGTVVLSQNGQALILTCGHIFRDMQPTDQLFVDFYRDGNWVPVPARVLQFFADKNDIGMVQCELPFAVQPVGINYTDPIATGSPVFTIGCDRGTPPNLIKTQITHLNRYLGEPNIEVAGAPVDGRSGGGLFDAEGHLIGVCNAADHQDNEGIYAGQGQIIFQLSSLALNIPSARSRTIATETGNAAIPQKPDLNFNAPTDANNSGQDNAPRIALDTARGQNEWLPSQSATSAPQTASAASEVVMFVRNGQNPPREVRVPNPSPELLQWIDQQAQSPVATPQHP